MNFQIFRRAAIAETGPQIHLEAADPPDMLDPRQFGLAVARRKGGEMLLSDVAAHHEDAADAVVFVDRAEAVGPVDLVEPPVTRPRDELVLVPGRGAAAHHLLDLGTDDRPDLGPALPSALAERARMTLGSHGLAIGVVVELDQFGTPPDEHRMVGIEQDAHRRPQTLRPAFRTTERN